MGRLSTTECTYLPTLIPVLHQLEASSVLADVPIPLSDPQFPALQQQRNGPQILQLLFGCVHSLLVLQPLEAGCNGTDPLLLICDILQCFFKITQIFEILASS